MSVDGMPGWGALPPLTFMSWLILAVCLAANLCYLVAFSSAGWLIRVDTEGIETAHGLWTTQPPQAPTGTVDHIASQGSYRYGGPHCLPGLLQVR